MSDPLQPTGLAALVRKLSEVSVIRFGVVGVSNTAISFVIYWFMSHVVPVLVAQGVSYGAGMLWSLYWNRRWTFKSASSGDSKEAGRFLGLQIGFLILSSVLVKWLVEYEHVHSLIAWFAVAAFVTVLNFVASRYWAFRAA